MSWGPCSLHAWSAASRHHHHWQPQPAWARAHGDSPWQEEARCRASAKAGCSHKGVTQLPCQASKACLFPPSLWLAAPAPLLAPASCCSRQLQCQRGRARGRGAAAQHQLCPLAPCSSCNDKKGECKRGLLALLGGCKSRKKPQAQRQPASQPQRMPRQPVQGGDVAASHFLLWRQRPGKLLKERGPRARAAGWLATCTRRRAGGQKKKLRAFGQHAIAVCTSCL